MDIEIRSIRSEEFDAWLRGMSKAFNEYPRDEWLEMERKLIEPERTFAAIDGDEFVGGASTASMRIAVPGDEVAMAGVTGVGVAPTHRRRGVATMLMRHQLDHVRERGEEPIAALHASEGGIYGRFGYGVATSDCAIEIERERTAFLWLPPERGRVRLVDRGEAFAAMEPIYDAVRRTQPGMIERRGMWWDARFEDFEHDREGASPFFFALHEGPDGDDAYAVYRFKHDWPQAMPNGSVDVEELVATTPDAYACMWRFVFDLDLAARIKAELRPIDDPLLGLLVEPRRLRLTVRDGMWLRLVDVSAALAARRYRIDGSLVLEGRDHFCPWNDGRYRIEGGPDGASCRPTDAEPDLAMSASELGAAFLGGASFRQLARAGRVHEERSGALRRADLMFGWDLAPWCTQLF
jgi:predicted acetyltransferase